MLKAVESYSSTGVACQNLNYSSALLIANVLHNVKPMAPQSGDAKH